MNELRDSLAQVQELLGRATPGEWPEPEASRFVPDKFNVGDGAPYMLVARSENDLRAAVAAVNWLRKHGQELMKRLEERGHG